MYYIICISVAMFILKHELLSLKLQIFLLCFTYKVFIPFNYSKTICTLQYKHVCKSTHPSQRDYPFFALKYFIFLPILSISVYLQTKTVDICNHSIKMSLSAELQIDYFSLINCFYQTIILLCL